MASSALTIHGPQVPDANRVLTPDALTFLTGLFERFEPRPGEHWPAAGSVPSRLSGKSPRRTEFEGVGQRAEPHGSLLRGCSLLYNGDGDPSGAQTVRWAVPGR